MNNVIHDNLSSVTKVPIIIQKFDYKQMFDGMDSEEACGDIFSYGVEDNHLSIIHEANKNIVISVKTSQGESKTYKLTNKTMQGDTWAPALASAQVDSFGKDMIDNKPSFMFMFKGEVAIPLLGQVDDLLGVAEAGFRSEQLNAFVNVKAADKDLQFGPEKCTYMVVSKMKLKDCHKSELFVDSWKINHQQNGNFDEEFMGKVPMIQEKYI